MNFTDIDPCFTMEIQNLMLKLTSEARIELLNTIFDGYCKECGRECERQCFCTRDD